MSAPARRALAFLACPPPQFATLLARLRAAAPGASWDVVCFYPPPEDPAVACGCCGRTGARASR